MDFGQGGKVERGQYRGQVRKGRLFLHEHPRDATSWGIKEIEELSSLSGVITVDADMCMFGLTTFWRNKK